MQIATGNFKQGENSANHVISKWIVCYMEHTTDTTLKNVYMLAENI